MNPAQRREAARSLKAFDFSGRQPAYRYARFRAELPRGGLPECFAVITACNPIPPADNDHRTRQLQAQLIQRGLEHFPVTGFDPRSSHEEAGFGVL